MRRRTRFRCTAPPSFLPTAYATRSAGSPACSTQVTVTGPTVARQRELRRRSKLSRSRTRPTRRATPTRPRASIPTSSGRQALATLASSSLEDRSARPRRHPVPETMTPRPSTRLGLKRPLHGSLLAACPRDRHLTRPSEQPSRALPTPVREAARCVAPSARCAARWYRGPTPSAVSSARPPEPPRRPRSSAISSTTCGLPCG
jgi:hypothetical protein